MAVKIRFECLRADRASEPYGPFEFVQLTYNDLRVGPDGDFFAVYRDGDWWFTEESRKHGGHDTVMRLPWSDVIIYPA